MRRLLLATTILCSLAAAPAATSNASAPFVICGAKKCITTENPSVTEAPMTWSTFVPTASAAPPQPYYWVGLGDKPWITPAHFFYIPGPSLLRVPGGTSTFASWAKLTAHEAAAFHKAVRQLAPYPKPAKLTSVVVDRSTATDPTSYLQLLTIGTPTTASLSDQDWLAITLSGPRTSPWTDSLASLAVSRHGSYLKREGRVFAIPAKTAARARAAKSLR